LEKEYTFRNSFTFCAVQVLQFLPHILWNLKVHYCIQKSLPPVTIPSQLNPVHTPHPTSSRSTLILSSHLCLGLPSGLLPSSYPTKTLYTPVLAPMHATCPAHRILLDFITRTILGEEYRSLSSSLCSFLHSLLTSSLSGANILPTPYSQISLAYVFTSMSATKFHTHTKQQDKNHRSVYLNL